MTECCSEPTKEDIKPTLNIAEDYASGLKGKTVGDKCEFLVSGVITSVRKPDKWEQDRGSKSNMYTVEINKTKNYGSKREY
jgi:hypothetical protein